MNEYIKKFWEENGYEVREELYGAPKKEMNAVKWDMNKDIYFIYYQYIIQMQMNIIMRILIILKMRCCASLK
tara:strand:+ start:304 stop:519 length:216 start_codon:yes stop_codon:yes gene_type:complete